MLEPNLFQSVHFVLSIIGLAISILIIKHELGHTSRIINQLCDGKESTSCDDVLDSKGASVLNFFKLSDIGIVYFLGLTLSWIANLFLGLDSAVIEVVSLIAMPITFYSIYYQYAVVKKWCPLCLAVVIILWCQSGSLFFESTLFTNVGFGVSNVLILLAGFVTSATIWMVFKTTA